MPRVVGVDIPGDKRILIALTYIYGIGKYTARQILKRVGIDESVRAKDLTEDELSRLASDIEAHCIIEGQLRRQISISVGRLKDIGCYRGLRHRKGLPARGQRTKTNARTRKGPRRTVATKKSVKTMR
jgi:small subunit ribosomal protein S13